MILRTLSFAILPLAIVLSPASADSDAGQEPTTVALLFYADWCGSCKELDPKLREARSALADEPVLFLTFDHTDEETSRQAAMLAHAVDLEEIYAEHAGRTGFLLLVHPDEKAVVGQVTREATPDEIRREIAKSLNKEAS